MVDEHIRLAEALVFASTDPVPARALQQLLPPEVEAESVLKALMAQCEGRGVVLMEVAGGWQFRTAADLAPALRRVVVQPRRLPRAAMETLAIIAYHQPVTRPEIEEMRGTSLSQQTMDALLEHGLIAAGGRREVPGRPTLWGTTPAFLAQFGLRDLRDLPRREDLLVEPPPVVPMPLNEAPGQEDDDEPDTVGPDEPLDTSDGAAAAPQTGMETAVPETDFPPRE
jgi:segregation and condensation protein B